MRNKTDTGERKGRNMDGLPQEFKERMERLLGAEYEAFLESQEREAAQALRVNTLKITWEELERLAPFSLPVRENAFWISVQRPGERQPTWQLPWKGKGFSYPTRSIRPGQRSFPPMWSAWVSETAW